MLTPRWLGAVGQAVECGWAGATMGQRSLRPAWPGAWVSGLGPAVALALSLRAASASEWGAAEYAAWPEAPRSSNAAKSVVGASSEQTTGSPSPETVSSVSSTRATRAGELACRAAITAWQERGGIVACTPHPKAGKCRKAKDEPEMALKETVAVFGETRRAGGDASSKAAGANEGCAPDKGERGGRASGEKRKEKGFWN